MYNCTQCDKIFTNIRGLAGHKRMHGESNGTTTHLKCCCLITRQEMNTHNLEKYQKALIPCKQCDSLFHVNMRGQTFCSQSCSAKNNNAKRGERPTETRLKIKNSMLKRNSSRRPTKAGAKIILAQYKARKQPKSNIVGPFSKIFHCKCQFCNEVFVTRAKKKYCLLHRDRFSVSAKFGYKFVFNIYDYPDLFDLALLSTVGWFSPGGRSGAWNINGLSRDHKISVNDSLKYNYDPYYITHPMNCELMPHSENNKKKTKSSISYAELVFMVDNYVSTYMAPKAGIEPATK